MLCYCPACTHTFITSCCEAVTQPCTYCGYDSGNVCYQPPTPPKLDKPDQLMVE